MSTPSPLPLSSAGLLVPDPDASSMGAGASWSKLPKTSATLSSFSDSPMFWPTPDRGSSRSSSARRVRSAVVAYNLKNLYATFTGDAI